ncbi:MAG: sigma-54-dependent Fis family transcriptional regulator [Desulfobacterales bacterium]|nr:sigma-54-dependent Fis family transcriptional regulator [Desulfobacterales bacterium]
MEKNEEDTIMKELPQNFDYKKYPVLIVDDDESFLKEFVPDFSEHFTFLTAKNGDTGLMLVKNIKDISVVIADQLMPRMKGLEMLKKIKKERPDITRMLITAYDSTDTAVESINRVGIFRYIHKSFEYQTVRGFIQEGIERHWAVREQTSPAHFLVPSNPARQARGVAVLLRSRDLKDTVLRALSNEDVTTVNGIAPACALHKTQDPPAVTIIDDIVLNKSSAADLARYNHSLLIITDREEVRKKAAGLFGHMLTDFIAPQALSSSLAAMVNIHLEIHDKTFYRRGHERLIIGFRKMAELVRSISRLITTEQPILLCGPTGSGKGILAGYIHYVSGLKRMVSVNCAAIPMELCETYFYGHTKGAFTGAIRDKRGYFEQANDGILFLDEIGDLSLDAQAKILTVFDGMPFQKVGGENEFTTNARLVAATNKDLGKMVAEGRFRQDLYHRLSGITFQIPPLAERRDEIPLLAHYFLIRAKARLGKDCRLSRYFVSSLARACMDGNIRKMASAIDVAVAMAESGETIRKITDLNMPVSAKEVRSGPFSLTEELQFFERDRLLDAANRFSTMEEAADFLGMHRITFGRRLEYMGINWKALKETKKKRVKD